jgi:hypothetical protein
MCFLVFLCCVVLRPCIGLIPRPRSPTKCPNRFISSEVRILNRNRQWMAYTLKHDDVCYKRVYLKVSGLAAWGENCKWYSSLPLCAVVSLFCESV